MSWAPFETSLEDLDGIKPNFEQYAQQDDYGLKTLRPKNVQLTVDEDLYDQQTDTSKLSVDARAELEMDAYRRKLGNPRKRNVTGKWEEQEEDTVESEISNMLRQTGLDHEPPSNFRPSSKTTSRSAIQIDRIPVPGVSNLFLNPDHFKFPSPYVNQPTKKPTIPEKQMEIGIEKTDLECGPSTTSDSSSSNKQNTEPTPSVAGEKYNSPRQLYRFKSRKNR